MVMRHALSITSLVASLLLTACASAPVGPPEGATHPAWLTGTWQGSAWQVQSAQTQAHTDLTVTFTADGSWKASTGAAGASWLMGDKVVLMGVAADGARIRYTLKEREHMGGRELWGVVEASYGAAAVSLKPIR